MPSDAASLFEVDDASRPLADRLRPRRLADMVGQEHLLGPEAPLTRMVSDGSLASIILWGRPGCGKTTVARLLADDAGFAFASLSATFWGVADLRTAFEDAARRREIGQRTLLFVDEIHRFDRAQQDAFLPYVEDGTIVLVGATTENPSFELDGALRSRCQVLVLRRLDDAALRTLLARAESLSSRALPLDAAATDALVAFADGDGRALLDLAEQLLALPSDTAPLDAAGLGEHVQRRAPLYDKSQESHCNLISALHTAMRGSDPDAAPYWLARMLLGGEDPLHIARRLVRFANEDVGLADPRAVQQALAAWDAYERLGSPEGELAIAQAVVLLATAEKSIAVSRGLDRAMREARRSGSLMPPAHILNAPTALMRQLGYGADYAYDPDAPDGFSGQDSLPDGLERRRFSEPTANGDERAVGERLRRWERLRSRRRAAREGVAGEPSPP